MAANETLDLDSMDDLLDRSLDDIADLPEFNTFWPGVHKCKIKWEAKKFERTVDNVKKQVPHMQLTLEYVELMEHADAKHDESPAKAGDKCSTSYDLTNENAMGALKKATKSLGIHLGTTNVKEIIKGSQDFEVAVVVKNRFGKDDKTVRYLQVEDMLPL